MTSRGISDLKKESMNQRVYTLKRFTEPDKFDDKEVMSFLVKVGMNVLTLVLMVVMIPMVLMSSPEEEEEEGEKKQDSTKEEAKEEAEEEQEDDTAGAEMDDPDKDDDEGSESGTPLLTKQEKRALAIQRAKDSMKEDKENVQRVLRKRK